jgi:hypothetical protein
MLIRGNALRRQLSPQPLERRGQNGRASEARGGQRRSHPAQPAAHDQDLGPRFHHGHPFTPESTTLSTIRSCSMT